MISVLGNKTSQITSQFSTKFLQAALLHDFPDQYKQRSFAKHNTGCHLRSDRQCWDLLPNTVLAWKKKTLYRILQCVVREEK